MTNRRFLLTGCLQVFLCLLALGGMNAVAEQVVQPLKEKAKTQVNATAGFSTGLQSFLNDIQEKKEWKIADVMELVPRLQLYRTELENFQHLPNQEALKARFPHEGERHPAAAEGENNGTIIPDTICSPLNTRCLQDFAQWTKEGLMFYQSHQLAIGSK